MDKVRDHTLMLRYDKVRDHTLMLRYEIDKIMKNNDKSLMYSCGDQIKPIMNPQINQNGNFSHLVLNETGRGVSRELLSRTIKKETGYTVRWLNHLVIVRKYDIINFKKYLNVDVGYNFS